MRAEDTEDARRVEKAVGGQEAAQAQGSQALGTHDCQWGDSKDFILHAIMSH